LIDITLLPSLALSSLSVLASHITLVAQERAMKYLPSTISTQRSLLYDGVTLNAFSRISLAFSVDDLDAHSPSGEDEIALTIAPRQLHGFERPFCLLDVIAPQYPHEWLKSSCNIRANRSMVLYCCIKDAEMRQNAGPTSTLAALQFGELVEPGLRSGSERSLCKI
jgi:hypothetical protein